MHGGKKIIVLVQIYFMLIWHDGKWEEEEMATVLKGCIYIF